MTEQDLAQTFGAYAAGVTFEQVPSGARRAAAYSTLDTVGVILGASGLMDVMPAVIDLAQEWSGREDSTVLGYGGRMSALSAAFVNGSMGHGLDFDDHLPEGHHPSVTLLPALLALAERRGGVSGREFLTAMAVGQDLFARLRKNVDWKQDWFMTPVVGAISSAAAASRLLGLTAAQTANAIGIASAQSSMTMQCAYGTGGDLRGMYGGFGAKAAVLATQLAEKGVQSTSTPLEGRAGFLPVYFGDWDRAAMTAELGSDFQGETILYKMWPSCGVTHAYIDTALRLMEGPGHTDQIERIEVFGGDFARQLSEPVEFRRRPPTSNDAKFSIPYTLALALTGGTIRVGDFSVERREDPELFAVASKVDFTEDASYNWGKELPPGAIRITLTSGEVRNAEAHHDETPGAVKNPLTWDQLVAKFQDCAGHAAHKISTDQLLRFTAAVEDLEHVDDVAQLPAILS